MKALLLFYLILGCCFMAVIFLAYIASGGERQRCVDSPETYIIQSTLDGTIFYKFKLPEVQIYLHFG